MSLLSFFRPGLLNPPGLMKPWAGSNGQAFREVIAGELDATLIAAEQVADARNVMKCDPTVLPAHEADRRIRRYTTESELSWRRRLAAWLAIWRSAGGAYCILRQLRIFLAARGRPMIRFVTTTGSGGRTQWFTLAPGDGIRDYFAEDGLDPEFTEYQATPANWDWDGNLSQWSRFWILIYTSGLTDVVASTEYDGTGEWDGGADHWDGSLTSDEITGMVELCTEWKAAGSRLQGLFLVHDDTIFDPTGSGAGYPDGTWDLWTNRLLDGVTYSYVR